LLQGCCNGWYYEVRDPPPDGCTEPTVRRGPTLWRVCGLEAGSRYQVEKFAIRGEYHSVLGSGVSRPADLVRLPGVSLVSKNGVIQDDTWTGLGEGGTLIPSGPLVAYGEFVHTGDARLTRVSINNLTIL